MAELRRVGPAKFPTWAGLPPLWTLVVAASFFGYFALLVYCDVFRPKNPGFEADPTHTGAVVVTRVEAATPAFEAGISVGDHLIAINGLTIIDSDGWGALGSNYQIGVAMPVIVERNGVRVNLSILLPPESADYWLTRTGATLIFFRLAQLMPLMASLFIVWRRPRDPRALAAAWFLATCAVFIIALPYRFATVWRGMPILLRELFWIPYFSGLTIGPILLTFVTVFPTRLPYAGYVQAGTWAVAGAAVASPLYHATQLIYRGTELRPVGPRSLLLLGVVTASLLTAVALIVWHYRRTTDVNERRRLGAVVLGIAFSALPGFLAVVYFWLVGHTNQAQSIFASPGMGFAALGLLAAPLSIAYAVLRHRLFEISFIIRKGLQYALARRAVLSVVPFLSILLILDLLLQGDQTVNDVLRRRWPQYLTVMLAAFVVFANRRRWLKAIDRRFFRERNYAFAVLQDVAEQVRRAGSLDRVAPVVVAKIESAMHPEFAALMVRDPEARAYRTIAAAPSAAGPPDLREDSKLVAHARIVEEPLDTSKDSGEPFLRKLSSSDREYITNAGIDAVIRIVTPDEELHALLVLGPKRSEEPYAEEDFGVLVTIAENLSLLAARSVQPRDQTPTLEECPECGACFDAGTGTCSTHSRPLAATALPRTLLGRYRLDRRLAAGGMGTVYKAFDLALDHDVAAKVIGDAVIAKDGALERFFGEAKILASLRDHPNVVTVYDFGRIGHQQAYLIMELLVGRTLRQLLESDRRIQPPDALEILEDVASAMTAAHRLRLLHRDLKPENIFLVDSGRGMVAKVLDFGIAKPLSLATTVNGRRETGDRILLGTLEYMSPEQRRGEPPSKAWDIWSLAVVALEMLSGRPPMSTMTPDVGPWRPGNALKDTLPACVSVFNRALSIDPTERPPDADALVREIATGLRVELQPAGHAYRRA